MDHEIPEAFRPTEISNPDWESIKDPKPTKLTNVSAATVNVTTPKAVNAVGKCDILMRFTRSFL
jgi:hypothetical protein